MTRIPGGCSVTDLARRATLLVGLLLTATQAAAQDQHKHYWNSSLDLRIVEGEKKQVCRAYAHHLTKRDYGWGDPYCERLGEDRGPFGSGEATSLQEWASDEHSYLGLLNSMQYSIGQRRHGTMDLQATETHYDSTTQAHLKLQRIHGKVYSFPEAVEEPFPGFVLALLHRGAACRNRDSNTGSPLRAAFLLDPSTKTVDLKATFHTLEPLADYMADVFVYEGMVYLDVVIPDYENRQDFFQVYSTAEGRLAPVCLMVSE